MNTPYQRNLPSGPQENDYHFREQLMVLCFPVGGNKSALSLASPKEARPSNSRYSTREPHSLLCARRPETCIAKDEVSQGPLMATIAMIKNGKWQAKPAPPTEARIHRAIARIDRKSTRLNSSHRCIS